MPELTAARLREVLHYDPTSGVFTWLAVPGRRNGFVGAQAGRVHKETRGYVKGGWSRWRARITVNGRERSLGYFETEADATRAYQVAKQAIPGAVP